ncbi:MAG: MBL fold metallo-hydrolase [Albidovulum sp.]|nr:MBL fold metallo-hydrolase [Albidovulum sp.]
MTEKSPFNTDFSPPVGKSETIAEGLMRIVAPNASAMTFTGTNTYVLGVNSVAVIDPGPDDPAHIESILTSLPKEARITEILVTHAHLDHSAAAARLSKLTGAPVSAFGGSESGRNSALSEIAEISELGGRDNVDTDFMPDIEIRSGSLVNGDGWTVEAIWTPGHFGSHLCYAWHEGDSVFSGDVLMGWATTLISPPYGHVGDFMKSMDLLAKRKDSRYFPGHGAPIDDPQGMIAYQVLHRREREAQIVARLENDALTPREIAESIYIDVDSRLIPAATRNVFAHLLHLWERGLVKSNGRPTPGESFFLI